MAIPNLIGLLLSGVVVAETRDFKKIRAKEKFDKKQAGHTTNVLKYRKRVKCQICTLNPGFLNHFINNL